MYKTSIVQLCQRNSWSEPVYSTVEEGPDDRSTFTATVIVNGVSFQAPEKCSSKQEAQNKAAKVALDQLSTVSSNQTCNPSLHEGVVPTSSSRLPSDARRMYKVVLQNYAQKRKMAFPEYKSECEGPSLAKRYKSRVTVGGQVHESPKSYRTIREAEAAAATVACELLLQNDLHEEELFIFKPLLQELAAKRGLTVNFVTTKLDKNKFTSSVEMGGRTFNGQPSESKKKAEMKAAKVAYTTTVQECNLANQRTELVGSQHTTTTTTMVQSQELIVTDNAAHPDPSGHSLKDVIMEDSLSVSIPDNKGESNPNVPVAELIDLEINVEGSKEHFSDIEAKKCDSDFKNLNFPEATELPIGLSDASKVSLSVNVKEPLPSTVALSVNVEDPLPSPVLLLAKEPANQCPASVSSITINKPSLEPFLELIARENVAVTLTCDKLAIYPRVPNLKFPEDGSFVVLPFESDHWVVVGVITKK